MTRRSPSSIILCSVRVEIDSLAAASANVMARDVAGSGSIWMFNLGPSSGARRISNGVCLHSRTPVLSLSRAVGRQDDCRGFGAPDLDRRTGTRYAPGVTKRQTDSTGITSGSWPVPARVWLEGVPARLRWEFDDDPGSVTHSPRVLDDFAAALSEVERGDVEALCRFTSSWGVPGGIWLQGRRLPGFPGLLGLADRLPGVGPVFAGIPSVDESSADGFAYLRLGAHLIATVRVAASLRRGEPVDPRHWGGMTWASDFTLPVPDLAAVEEWVGRTLTGWAGASFLRSRPTFTRAGVAQAFEATGLDSGLVAAAIEAADRGWPIVPCDACGSLFVQRRTPWHPDYNNFCPAESKARRWATTQRLHRAARADMARGAREEVP